jgi:hypothetical protein
MKLIKDIEVASEEIKIKNGIYFFSAGYLGEEPCEYYKVGNGNWVQVEYDKNEREKENKTYRVKVKKLHISNKL